MRFSSVLWCLGVSFSAFASPDAGADAGTPWNVEAPGFPSTEVTIDVREGTWLSVDVSPKGDSIAFDLLGDLYLLPIAGGEARELTHGISWDMQPRFSPDGKSLAFTSDRGGGDNIWVLPLDGGVPTQVTNENFRLPNSPAWSPDGRFIVAHKHFTSRRSLGTGELWLYERTGTAKEGVQLTEKDTDQKDLGEPAFSPDGRYVYFSKDVTPGKVFQYSKDPNGEIYDIMRLDLDRKVIAPFIAGPGGSIRPTPSPDGKSLAFVRRIRGVSVLMLADVVSGAERVIYEGLDRDLQETWAVHGVSPSMGWTPDSKTLVFWAKGGLWRIDVASRALKSIPFHVKTTRTVAQAVRSPQVAAPPAIKMRITRWPSVSPKGDRAAFEALGKIWVKALPGEARRLTTQTTHRELYPSFTSDGSILYSTWSDTELGTLRLAPTAGGEGRVLTKTPGHYVESAMSPDGRTVVYRSSSGSNTRSALYSRDPGLFALNVADGSTRKLNDNGSAPHFAASSTRVYFTTVDQSGKDDVFTLKSVNVDASDERTHLTSDEALEYRLSPDGAWLAWRENFVAYLMPFPRGGKAPVAAPESKALPIVRLSEEAGGSLQWSGDSKRVFWAQGGQLFSKTVAEATAKPSSPARGTPLMNDVKAAVVEGVEAFVGARVITMRDDEVIEDGVVLVRDGRITAVGPRATTPIPAGAKVFDLKGKTVMPGLVDVHWHGTIGADGIIPQQNWTLLAGLAFGVTTAHDPSNDTETFFAGSQMARAGELVAPRLFSTGTILYGAQNPERAIINSLDDARGHLRRQQQAGAFSVKSYNQPRREQRQQVLQAARELGMLVVPEGGSLFHHNMTMIIDGHTGVEHSLPLANLYEDVLQLWSHSATGYTPTLGVAYGGWFGENYWYEKTDVWADPRLSTFVPRRALDARSRRRELIPDEELNQTKVAAMAKLLNDRGISVQLGAHGQREGLAAHWELWNFALGGMTPMQALRVGTINGARYLGLDRDIGSLEVGKLADLIVLDENPLADLHNSRAVRLTVIAGRVWDSATMNEVWPKATVRAPLFFEREGSQTWPIGATDSHTFD